MNNRFLGMEADISNAATAAQILASLFEAEDERHSLSDNRAGPMVLHDHEADLIRFMIYDLCTRTNEVKKLFYALSEEEAASRVAKAA